MLRQVLVTLLLLILALWSAGCVTGKQVSAEPACGGYGPVQVTGTPPERDVIALSPFAEGSYWYLNRKMQWISNDHYVVVTPKGFVTDFASVPRPLWAILPKWEGYGVGAVIHDYLYWSQHTTRRDADQWLLHTMQELNVGWFHSRVIWGTVRVFGSIAWNGNARRRMNRDIQCLQDNEFPVDPTLTWAQVKTKVKSKNEPPDIPIPPAAQSQIYR